MSEIKSCPRCGAPRREGQKFCVKCGTVLGADDVQRQQVQPQSGMPYLPRQAKKQKSSLGLAITLGVVIALLLGVIGFGAYQIITLRAEEARTSASEEADKKKEKESKPTKEPEKEEPAKNDRLLPAVDSYINQVSFHSDLSVAIVDNKTGEVFNSQGGSQRYVAWGFYLPVYLAYTGSGYTDARLRENMLSSSAATCNQSANEAINYLGGLGSVNSYLQRNFGATATYYGRYFGQTNTQSDNYTSAAEAVQMVKRFHDTDSYSRFSYNPGSFGIYPPSTATVFSQIGTENNNVRNQLNFFAIVKGQYSDYCIVVLSQNSAGVNISGLLNVVHNNMEQYHYEKASY